MSGTDTGTNTDTPVPAMTEYTGKPQKLLCWGFGAAARTLAEGLKGAGWEVTGTCRDMAEVEGQPPKCPLAVCGEEFEDLI